jgi:hypothetical protein
MPPAEPQQLKVAPATWALLGLRHVQVYAVTLRSRLKMKLRVIIIINGEMCVRGEQSKDQATNQAKEHGRDFLLDSKI